ncbi:DarT ssDNA thymidine ADP-ribosyltransferase family protein [Sphingobium fuliginis]|uniref:DarT domain-containing protein n=1 Tax=Sphingobium fuliginis (strain ATCC 27551) TaxID=336203 RepID=A0ABQ1ET68_SPHSA|nr:DarT ssDNA thymidine ADP-ribosyltransferase family protein [Sphingobium fuliginis]GFZ86267.1 hypothetical protein GCM10019071_14560 [Sphingobium fuliginis]
MIGGIFGFQALIILTILVTRLIAKGKLLLLCGAWTVFTLVMVFATPLILLQLLVIWGTYSLVAPKESGVVQPPDTAPTRRVPSPSSPPFLPGPTSKATPAEPTKTVSAPHRTEKVEAAARACEEDSNRLVQAVKPGRAVQQTVDAVEREGFRDFAEGQAEAVNIRQAVAPPASDRPAGSAQPPETRMGKALRLLKEKGELAPDPKLEAYFRERLLQTRVSQRSLPFLVHFTRVENLPSIMCHGLRSISAMQSEKIAFRWNDEQRLDGHEDAVSLSIAHPNDKLFYRWRMSNPQQGWAVLLLDPSVLWTCASAFCAHNAADRRISRQERTALSSVAAFDAMFADQDGQTSRSTQNLRLCDPTDVQAEILVFDPIPAALVSSAIFSDHTNLTQWRDLFPGRDLQLHADRTGLFGLRSAARAKGKG